jgi:hypothetical protein
MTIEEQAIQQSASRKMALIELMVAHGEAICDGCLKNLFDLTIASPGIVVSLYVHAHERIEMSDLAEEVKATMRKGIQYQVQQLLKMVLAVVSSTDPRQTLLTQNATIMRAEAMGETDGEIH